MPSSLDMISNFDLKLIHEIFNDINTQYVEKSLRLQYFLLICSYLDVDIAWMLF